MAIDKRDLPEKKPGGKLVDPAEKKQDALTSGKNLQGIQNEYAPKQDQLMRRRLLANIGVKPAKPTSENLIIFSCSAVNGWATMQVRSFLWLLDRLGIDYTYLTLPEKEYCCGWTNVRNSNGEEKVKAFDTSKNCIGLNIAQARKIGAKHMFYFCRWCNTAAQYAFPGIDITQRYHLDLLVEALKQKPYPFKMERPTRVAYYEGCHKGHEILVPNCRFDWPAYRKLLDDIDSLEVIDLPSKVCCTVPGVSDRLINQSIEVGAAQLITPCTSCSLHIQEVGQVRKFPVKLVSELLLEATGVKDEWLDGAKYGKWQSNSSLKRDCNPF
jgi:Fe-S oxidoreductase